MTNLDTTLRRIEDRAEAATAGPWLKGSWSGQCHLKHEHGRGACKYDYKLDSDFSCVSTSVENQELIGWGESGTILNERDANFIAAARTDVPKLCKALRRALDFLDVLGSDLIKADIAAILAEQEDAA